MMKSRTTASRRRTIEDWTAVDTTAKDAMAAAAMDMMAAAADSPGMVVTTTTWRWCRPLMAQPAERGTGARQRLSGGVARRAAGFAADIMLAGGAGTRGFYLQVHAARSGLVMFVARGRR
jgi:hypothetical protein